MVAVGFDTRNHGQSAGTPLTSGNVNTYAYGGSTLGVTTGGSATVTLEGTDTVRFTDPDGTSFGYINSTTALTGDACSGMIYIPSTPTPGTADYRSILVRNSANNADVVRLIENSAREWHLYDGGGVLMCGPSPAITAGNPVRIGFAFDISAGNAWLWIYTTNPVTSTTPDNTYPATSQTFNGQTNIGVVRFGGAHSSGIITLDSHYSVVDDTTISALAPLSSPVVVSSDTQVLSVTLSGVSGGDGGPYNITNVAQLTGTSVGSFSFSGLTFWGTQMNVDACTFDVTVEDGSANTDVYTVSIDAPATGTSTNSGVFIYDPGTLQYES